MFRKRQIFMFLVGAIVVGLAVLKLHSFLNDWTPDGQISRYRISDFFSPPTDVENLALGSSTVRWMPDLALGCGEWHNRAIGRATGSDILRYVNSAPERSWRRVLLYTGDNDIAFGATAEEAMEKTVELVEVIRRKFSPESILVYTVKISPARSDLSPDYLLYNSLLLAFASSSGDVVAADHPLANSPDSVDRSHFSEDGIHLSAMGYRAFFEPMRKICHR